MRRIWIAALLLIGGFALDRVLSRSFVDSFDNQLVYVLNSMVDASEIDPVGGVRFTRAPAEQRFIQPYSGLYFQISRQRCWRQTSFRRARFGTGGCRSTDKQFNLKPHLYDSDEFWDPVRKEKLRIAERDVILPGSNVRWRFQVAESREALDQADPTNPVLPSSGALARSASDC